MLALASDIANNPSGQLGFHEVMSQGERETVINKWNETSINYGYDGGLVSMLEDAAERDPAHPAIIFKDQTLSFGEFNGRVL